MDRTISGLTGNVPNRMITGNCAAAEIVAH
jgi:hypothetical protein